MRTCFASWPAPSVDWYDVARVRIDELPDVALLEIFEFYVHEAWEGAWYKLAHVCQKWRNLVFESPARLDLRLYCKAGTPVMKTLDAWPSLPIVLNIDGFMHTNLDMDDIVAALKHNDRICQANFSSISSLQLEKVLAEMRRPFPALTDLTLTPEDETAPVDVDSFLGGPALAPPHLQTLKLCRIPFPGLPKLLLSTTELVSLQLSNIPHSGYISPEELANGLSALTLLENLGIGFVSPRSRPDRKSGSLLPTTRALLPVLTELQFRGVSEYLEDLVARIDAPLLNKLEITFFHQLLFDTPHLARFISRTPKFKAYAEARVVFFSLIVSIATFDGRLCFDILCRHSDWQLSSLAQICGLSFPRALISTVERLYIEDFRRLRGPDDIEEAFRRVHGFDDIESSQWLELLHPFTGVKHLYISPKSMPSVAPALQELVAERVPVAEVLPALQTVFLEKLPSRPVQKAIEKFITARQLARHPIGVSRWEIERFETPDSEAFE